MDLLLGVFVVNKSKVESKVEDFIHVYKGLVRPSNGRFFRFFIPKVKRVELSSLLK